MFDYFKAWLTVLPDAEKDMGSTGGALTLHEVRGKELICCGCLCETLIRFEWEYALGKKAVVRSSGADHAKVSNPRYGASPNQQQSLLPFLFFLWCGGSIIFV